MKRTRKSASARSTTDPNLFELNVLPLRNVVLFPDMMAPLAVARDRSLSMIEESLGNGLPLALVSQRDANEEEPMAADLYPIGCTAQILRLLKFPDGTQRVLVQGLRRCRILQFTRISPNFVCEVELLDEVEVPGDDLELMARSLRETFRRFHAQSPNLPPELEFAISSIEGNGRLADFVASNLNLNNEEMYSILEALDVRVRMNQALLFLQRELEVQELANNIQKQVQAVMDKNQREYFLKEQLKIVKKELGELDVLSEEIDELREKITAAKMPPEVEKEARRELERMGKIHPEAAEYTVARTYLDWLLILPWNNTTLDNPDFIQVQKILDEDHYGLEKVKERIVEYLAVRKLKSNPKGPILCFLGPPGVGKTSLGKSIARALGRKFERISLGGIRDEAEIRGHRRTYIGSMPGRIIKAMKKAGTLNPVLMLDELDKVGTDFRGDPASALLEVLDPEQNSTFNDNYLDVPFDLSQVMFIATANMLDPIPSALKDRMEVIDIAGYIEEEKLAIARDYLIPKVLDEHGLTPSHLKLEPEAVKDVIRHYTREAGVRNLERKLARVSRKVAQQVASQKLEQHVLKPDNLETYLGPPEFLPDLAERVSIPGVAIGLAWTPTGGDILFIEASRMKGKKTFKVTGQLGEVMKESAEAALSYLRANAESLGIDPTIFDTSDIHVHIPAGAIPKDGPSAGVTLLTTLTSLIRGCLVRSDLAMTGEITLRGRVLPVGGIKEKVLAARRVGINDVVLPLRNKKDLVDIPAALKDGMNFHFVETVGEVLSLALLPAPEQAKPPTPTPDTEPAEASSDEE